MKSVCALKGCPLILSLALCFGLASQGCTRKIDDNRTASISKDELDEIPGLPTAGNANAETGLQGAFSLTSEEASAPLEIISYSLPSDEPATMNLNAVNPQSTNFRDWYSVAVEPAKSKNFDVSCAASQSESRARIVLVRLSEINPVQIVETVAFKIDSCDKVNYGLLKLTAGKSYALNARVYEYVRDPLDPASNLFSTHLLLEGSAIGISKGSTDKISIDYRRVADEGMEILDSTVGETGQDDLDIIRGKTLTLQLLASDPSDPLSKVTTPLPKIAIQLQREQSGRIRTLQTDAQGLATISNLPAVKWRVHVPEYRSAAGVRYPKLTDRLAIPANGDLTKTLLMRPEVYTWLFSTNVTVDSSLKLKVSITGSINEKADGQGLHLGYSFPAFLKYCEARVREKTGFVYAKKAADALKALAVKVDDTSTRAYKYLATDGTRLIRSTNPDYPTAVGAQANFPASPDAPWGAGTCTVGAAF